LRLVGARFGVDCTGSGAAFELRFGGMVVVSAVVVVILGK